MLFPERVDEIERYLGLHWEWRIIVAVYNRKHGTKYTSDRLREEYLACRRMSANNV